MTTELPLNARDLDDVFCGSEYKSEMISLDPQVTLNIMGSEKGSDMCSTFPLARFF